MTRSEKIKQLEGRALSMGAMAGISLILAFTVSLSLQYSREGDFWSYFTLAVKWFLLGTTVLGLVLCTIISYGIHRIQRGASRRNHPTSMRCDITPNYAAVLDSTWG